ncbi:MerR family transcriptional regulator [Massilia sp. X63]|uniref:MerR family transcriptional regulator n=1 Tax=Massilia sp. X63 TaxID=3237285 RepID=UPI0034DD32FE
MSKLVSITPAAKALGVSATTLRRWEASGRLVGSRSHRNRKLIDGVRQTVQEAQC